MARGGMALCAVVAWAAATSPASATTVLAPVSGPDALSTVSQRHVVRVAKPGGGATYLLAVQNGGVTPPGTSAWLTWWRSDDEGATWSAYRPILGQHDHFVADLVVVGTDVAAVYSFDTTNTTFPQDGTRDPQRHVFFQWWRYDGANDWNPGPLVDVASPPPGQAYHRAAAAVDSRGRVWIQAWLRDACDSCGDSAQIWVSTDGGTTFARQPDLAHIGLLGGGRLLSLGTRLLFLWGDYSWADPAQLMLRDDGAPLAAWTGPTNAFPDGDSIYHGAALNAVGDGAGGMHLVYKVRTGELYYRHFDGSTFGPRQLVDAPSDWALQPAITRQGGELFVWTTHVLSPNTYYQLRLYRLSSGFGSWTVVDDAHDFKGYPTTPEILPPGAPLVTAFAQGWWGTTTVRVSRSASPVAASDFAVSASPATVSGDASTTVTVSPVAGYTGTVRLAVSGVPAGATASFDANSLAVGPGAASATLVLSAGTAAAGSYPLVVTASDATGLRNTTSVTYTVIAPTAPDFALALAPTAVADAGTAVLTLTRTGGFGADVQLTVAGVPTGATATLGTTTLSGSQTSTTLMLSGGSAVAGTYTVTVTGSGGGLSHTAVLAFTVSPRIAPDFTVAVSPSSIQDSGVATVTVTAIGGYAGTVTLSVSGMPSGATAQLGSATIVVSAAAATTSLALSAGSAASGSYAVDVTGSDAAGLRHQASLTFAVSAAGSNPPIATLVDGFAGPGLSPAWTTQATAGSTATAGGGVLSLVPLQGPGFNGVFVQSAETWRLTGSAVQVRLAGTVALDGTVNEKFRVQGPPPMGWDDTLGFWLEGRELYAFYTAAGAETNVAAVPFSATNHAWWRIRESQGTILWETSPDGLTWSRLASTPSTSVRFSTDAAVLVFDAVAFASGGSSPGQAGFTALNQASVAPDFALATSPTSVTGAAVATVTATPVNGYAGTLALSVSGVPAGASAVLGATTIAVGPGPASTTLTLSPGSAAAGTYSIVVTAADASGLRHDAQLGFTVAPPPSGGAGPPPTGTPAVATLVDPFSGPGVSSIWTVDALTPGSGVSAGGGVLTIAPGQDAGFTGAFVKTAQTWRLTGSSVHVRVAGAVGAGANQKFRVQSPSALDWADTVGFWLESNALYAFFTVNGATTTLATVPFTANDAWWSIRESGGTLVWEVSPDGQAWTPLASASASALPFATDQVQVVLDAVAFSPGNAVGQARFSSLNQ